MKISCLENNPQYGIYCGVYYTVYYYQYFAERPGTAASMGSVSGEGVDVVRGGYLGRFVSDKTGNPQKQKQSLADQFSFNSV